MTRYRYDENGRLIETLRPNSTKQTRSYDAKGQLLQLKDVDAQAAVIVQYDFSYDAGGDIVEETVTPTPQAFPMASTDMTYGAANRLATYEGQAAQFDEDGNLTFGPLDGAMASFSYDSKRRLTQAGSTTYQYDAENHRIGINQTQFVVNSQPALSQTLVKTENGSSTYYVYGLGLIGEESTGGYQSYHFDYRGSTVALSDISGTVTERFQYSAYGVLVAGSLETTPFLFNGLYGVMTDSNRLYHMRARFYNPEIRRFLNRDVLLGGISDGQSLNRFVYVSGNPILLVDPEGLDGLNALIIGFTSTKPKRAKPRVPSVPPIGICMAYEYLNRHKNSSTMANDAWLDSRLARDHFRDDLGLNPFLIEDLRNAEHYLYAYYLTSENKYMWIPSHLLTSAYNAKKFWFNALDYWKVVDSDYTDTHPTYDEFLSGIYGSNEALFGKNCECPDILNTYSPFLNGLPETQYSR